MAGTTAHFLQMRAETAQVEIRVNDIPLVREEVPDRTELSVPVEEYLVEGWNRLALFAAPIEGGAPESARAVARVAEFEHGEFLDLDGGREAAQLLWSPQPRAMQAEFRAPPEGVWRWTTAPVLTLDGELRAALETWVAAVHGAFERREAERLNGLRSVYLDEISVAYNRQTADFYASDFEEMLLETPAEDWRVAPYEPRPDDFRLVAGGRLVDVVDAAGNPLVRQDVAPAPPGEPPVYGAEMPMLLGLVENRLRILR
jgi:hypothetical protein